MPGHGPKRSRSLTAEDADPAAADPPVAVYVRPLPLQAAVDALNGGWSVRLPVRTEHVTVTKEAMLLEEVRIWRASHEESQPVTGVVRSERLRVDSGDVEP